MATQVRLVKSANHPSDDASTAGGAKTAVEITGATVGEWFTRLKGKASGTLDVDIEKEYQKVFAEQIGASSLLEGRIQLTNGLAIPAGAGVAKFQSTSASDDNTKKVKVWGKNSSTGLLDTEEITLNGVTQVQGTKSWTQIYRTKLMLVSTGAIATAAGDIKAWVGTEQVGMIRTGYSYATSEIKLWAVATTNDSGTSTNRKTAPAGFSGSIPAIASFTGNTPTPLTSIIVRNDSGNDTLAQNDGQGLWGELTLQPGMPAINDLKIGVYVWGEETE